MLRPLSENLRAKFHAITLSYTMVKIARLDDAFSGIFQLEVSPVEGQSLQQKDKKSRKRKGGKKKKKEKTQRLLLLSRPKKKNRREPTPKKKNKH